MIVRPAIGFDAPRICDVMRASIEALCLADHQGNRAILGAWLANKTPENVAAWLDRPDLRLMIVERAQAVLGVGGITLSGEVVLNYVSPDARLQGVSSLLLDAMERQAWQDGNTRVTLDSTVTAHRFYQGRGYEGSGDLGEKFGLTTFPMRKIRAGTIEAGG